MVFPVASAVSHSARFCCCQIAEIINAQRSNDIYQNTTQRSKHIHSIELLLAPDVFGLSWTNVAAPNDRNPHFSQVLRMQFILASMTQMFLCSKWRSTDDQRYVTQQQTLFLVAMHFYQQQLCDSPEVSVWSCVSTLNLCELISFTRRTTDYTIAEVACLDHFGIWLNIGF